MIGRGESSRARSLELESPVGLAGPRSRRRARVFPGPGIEASGARRCETEFIMTGRERVSGKFICRPYVGRALNGSYPVEDKYFNGTRR
jgi:hypothetical protein